MSLICDVHICHFKHRHDELALMSPGLTFESSEEEALKFYWCDFLLSLNLNQILSLLATRRENGYRDLTGNPRVGP